MMLLPRSLGGVAFFLFLSLSLSLWVSVSLSLSLLGGVANPIFMNIYI